MEQATWETEAGKENEKHVENEEHGKRDKYVKNKDNIAWQLNGSCGNEDRDGKDSGDRGL